MLDDGDPKTAYGFYILPSAGNLVIENYRIAETRKSGGTQRIGIYKAAGAGSLQSRNIRMSGHLEGDYRDGAAARSGSHQAGVRSPRLDSFSTGVRRSHFEIPCERAPG